MPTELVPVASLKVFDSPRLQGENPEHTRMLANIDVKLPPVIVHRPTMRIIDGAHRVGAARLRGDEMIEARMFDGSVQEAFVLGVRANIMHGLPLSVADRSTAAERIVSTHPSWSDRKIAVATGLSARTVAGIRARLAAECGIGGNITARVGKDGRVRPLDSAEGRLKAVSFIKDRPDASLREIARNAGVSPSTAHDVRNRLQRGEDPLPSRRSAGRQGTTTMLPAKAVRDPIQPKLDAVLNGLKNDPALRFNESGRALLRWVLARVIQTEEWSRFTHAVPPHAAYVVAKVARLCAVEWQQFAEILEKQSSRPTG